MKKNKIICPYYKSKTRECTKKRYNEHTKGLSKCDYNGDNTKCGLIRDKIFD